MSGPIPVRPQEPRWWVSVNGQVEGPYGEAYIIACLNAGQIPAGALLCLEGATQWQPLSAWPQFTAAGTTPPPSQFSFTQVDSAPRISASSSTTPPDRVKTAITYARFWSPVVFGLTLVNTFSSGSDLENTLALFVFFAIETAGRGFMLLGANQVADGIRTGTTAMKVGSWILTAAISLRLFIVLGAVLVIMSHDDSVAGAQFNEQPPEQSSALADLTSLVVLIAFLIEFGYSFFFRAALSHFQRTRR
jgi:hypothetical protein